MHRELEKLACERIKHFVARLKRRILRERRPLTGTFRHSVTPTPFDRRTEGAPQPARPGLTWGKAWENAWFHLRGNVPTEWAGQIVAARLDFNGEALVFDAQGAPVYGLAHGSVFDYDYQKDLYRLFAPCRGGENVELWVEATASHLSGLDKPADPALDDPELHGRRDGLIQGMELCVLDETLWHLWLDADALLNLTLALPENHVRRAQLLAALNAAAAAYRDDPRRATPAREALSAAFAMPANPADLKVAAVGHAHIDVGWLWPVRESIRKAARTFASQGALFARYPDYIFGASQAVLYQMVKDHYPALYERIRGWIRDGRWEVQGGTWVEFDCNVISGESMIRQFVHGKNFFRDEFGVDVRTLWLPDVFGYSAAMPQILRRAGMEAFLTQKISWNTINTFPFTTFLWQGIDGSRVITHFPPEGNYNASNQPSSLLVGQDRFREKGALDEFLCLFGIGDGGGGPKEEHVERGLRLRNLNGCPRLRFDKAQNFFDRLSRQAHTLDLWIGELYLERHRATYTTQSRIKRGNRRMEQALRLTEFICACAAAEDYPRRELDSLWKTLLTNQFHDIIPGSSIHAVNTVAEQEYEAGLATCAQLAAAAAAAVLQPDTAAATFVNCLAQAWHGAAPLPATWGADGVTDATGRALPVQREADATYILLEVPATEAVTLRRQSGAALPATPDAARGLILENERIRYEFNPAGRLIRAYDKELNWEAIVDGRPGNRLSLYADRPYEYDAWEIDIHYAQEWIEDARAESAERIVDGPVRQGLRFRSVIGESSRIEQAVYLAHGSKRLDFVTNVAWTERHRMLRVAFPVAVTAAEATFDIQCGYARRPTHSNTSWDVARFETPALRYADLSSDGRGVALLNDCKHGYRVSANALDLNLLRSPTYPDPLADRGEHRFTYAILPHSGELADSDVMAQAAMLNRPPACFAGLSADASVVAPCRQIAGDGVTLETLKRAERSDDRVIRLVETRGRTSRATLAFSAATALIETDLLEWRDGPTVPVSAGVATVTLKPFEIRTYKLVEPPFSCCKEI